MKFELFKCECGYREISASSEPVCPDCGNKMCVMNLEEGVQHFIHDHFERVLSVDVVSEPMRSKGDRK